MWVKHVPGQCAPQSGGRSNGGGRGSVHTASADTPSTNSNAKGRANISKTKAKKELKALLTNNELDANELTNKIAELMFK